MYFIPYAYGTYHTCMVCTMCVQYNFVYHMRMVRVATYHTRLYILATCNDSKYSYSSTTTVSLSPIAPFCFHAPPIDSAIDYLYICLTNLVLYLAVTIYSFSMQPSYSYIAIVIYLKLGACMALNYSIICPA